MAETDREKLSLTNIKGGGAVEMFDRALVKVLDNINDINTTLKAREINLKVTFHPSEDRTLAAISVLCTPKLQGQEAEKLTADLRLDSQGRAFAIERFNNQRPLPFSNVTELSK